MPKELEKSPVSKAFKRSSKETFRKKYLKDV